MSALLLFCFVCVAPFPSISCPPVKQPKPRYAVTIAVSSRTLFNMVAERKVYEEEGVEKYVAFQVENENEPLKPGAAFPFVKVRGGRCACRGVAPLFPRPSRQNTVQTSSPHLMLFEYKILMCFSISAFQVTILDSRF